MRTSTIKIHGTTLALALAGLLACNGGGAEGEGESSTGSESDEIGDTSSSTSSTSTTESTTDTTESTTDTTESTTDTTESTTESTTDTTSESTTDTTSESTTDTTETTGVEGCAGECGTPGCGQCPNGPTVLGPGYRVDRTEVPVADYALFLEVPFSPALLHEDCGWKVSFEPDNWDEQLMAPDMPVVEVDWCDAEAFCRWQGRHLCGQIGGGAALFDDTQSVDTEWYAACTSQDTFNYPYGNVYEPMSCNGVDLAIGAPVAVGTLPDCVGGLPNLFDMSGNVREWANACALDPNIADDLQLCQRRGGAYVTAGPSLDCESSADSERNSRTGTTGIRCCDLP